MRKRVSSVMIACVLSTLLLVACGNNEDFIGISLNEFIEGSIMAKSEIESDSDYIRYEDISKTERIIGGYYSSDEVDTDYTEDPNAIHVTFAQNSFIKIQYFDDPGLSNELSSEEEYLHRNDSIYYNVIEVNNPYTDAYNFSNFEVWSIDREKRTKTKLDIEMEEPGLVYQIPVDFDGEEISIIPLGQYVQREITLYDYYKDINETENALEGDWEINGSITNEESVYVGPVSPYRVRYYYDPDIYTLIGADPQYLNNDEEEGIVTFEEYDSEKGIESFSVELRKKTGEIEFNPSQNRIDHAEIQYKYQGVVIDSPLYIPSGSKIEYEIIRVDDGYWISGEKNGETDVDRIHDVIKKIVSPYEKVTVNLPQPNRGGTIIYSINGEEIKERTVEALVGSKIQASFKPNNGWKCDLRDGYEYPVARKTDQIFTFEGKDVNNVFSEDQYKPELSLTIDKSVGDHMEFAIKAVDEEEKGLKLEDAKKTSEVFNKEIGTKDDLVLSAYNGTLLNGEALRIDVQKEDVNGLKEKDIQYIQKVPSDLKIAMYDSNRNTVYKKISLVASIVKISEYKSPSIDNGTIVIKTADLTVNRYLKKGDVIEGERKVELYIRPVYGYYAKGSTDTDYYKDEMKYFKYLSDMDSILGKHQVKKLCVVTLDSTDKYGTVLYKVDGNITPSGTYNLKEEQDLKLVYEITNENYEIDRVPAGWFDSVKGVTKKKTKETVNIPISSSIDGITISRETYIQIKEKEK